MRAGAEIDPGGQGPQGRRISLRLAHARPPGPRSIWPGSRSWRWRMSPELGGLLRPRESNSQGPDRPARQPDAAPHGS